MKKLPTVRLLRIEKNTLDFLAVQVFIAGIAGRIEDFPVPHFASSDVRSVSGRIRTPHIVVECANELGCARVSGMNSTGIRFG